MPYLTHLQMRFADDGLVVIGISSEDRWGNTLAARGDLLGAALAEMRAVAVSEGEMQTKQEERLAGFLTKLGVEPETSAGRP